MKKMIVSAGMLAVGAAGLNAANTGDLGADQTGKRWNVSAGLRGFYDDNVATAPSGPRKQGSGGVEFSPRASINLPMEQTYLSASYSFSLLYYFDRPSSDIDQTHTVDLKLDHKFTERHHLKMQESFVYSKEPTLVDQGGTITTPLRNEVEAVRNLLPIEYDWQISRLFKLILGYQNLYYNYFDSGHGSYSALLDRFDQSFRVDAAYALSPRSAVLVGYQFGLVSYTSDDRLAADPTSLKASARDSKSHYLYAGYQQEFGSHLSLNVRVGGKYTDYSELNETTTTPYADASLSYTYLPGDHLKMGIKQDHNSTDIAGAATSAATLVLDQDTTTVYLSVDHRVTQKLTAYGSVQYQHSVYNGGDFDGKADDYVTLALALAYKFTRNWSAELEYDFDKLLSDVEGREFARNRVYGGVRFTF